MGAFAEERGRLFRLDPSRGFLFLALFAPLARDVRAWGFGRPDQSGQLVHATDLSRSDRGKAYADRYAVGLGIHQIKVEHEVLADQAPEIVFDT